GQRGGQTALANVPIRRPPAQAPVPRRALIQSTGTTENAHPSRNIATGRSMAILGSRLDAAFRTVAAIMRLLTHLLRALPLLPVRSCQVHLAIPLTAPPWEL